MYIYFFILLYFSCLYTCCSLGNVLIPGFLWTDQSAVLSYRCYHKNAPTTIHQEQSRHLRRPRLGREGSPSRCPPHKLPTADFYPLSKHRAADLGWHCHRVGLFVQSSQLFIQTLVNGATEFRPQDQDCSVYVALCYHDCIYIPHTQLCRCMHTQDLLLGLLYIVEIWEACAIDMPTNR